ncbi:MAG: YabP/YqfC family sporulation protein [Clostridia bacterium]|nr:YabP/YqfC family sporulation protein [Clostridia bacterium]
MSFFDETQESLHLIKDNINDVVCTFSLSSGITVEGYRKILELSDTKVVLLCQNAIKLQILGTDFCVQEIAHGEICLSGQIDSIMKV